MYYPVKKLASMAGVSVRTLHLYDRIGLLKPAKRTEARYRLYGETELLRLQQILFYKELEFSLQEIADILDDPHFDFLEALEQHKQAILARRQRMDILLSTIDKTISNLQTTTKMKPEELYEGLPKEQAAAYRAEAIEKYGNEAVQRSEQTLMNMSKEDVQQLGKEQVAITQALAALIEEDPASEQVQALIARHYANIQAFWGTAGTGDPTADAYRGLGELYVQDERFTLADGKPQPEFARFLRAAMNHFADTKL